MTAAASTHSGFRFRQPQTIGLLAALLILAVAPHLMPNSYWLRVYSMIGIYVMLALGLNVVAGFAGLLDLAYVAFFGIGGYTFALLSSAQFDIHLPFAAALPAAAIVTMLCGFLLGLTSIRLRGDYLAIVTLAFAQIFKLLLLNLDRPGSAAGGRAGCRCHGHQHHLDETGRLCRRRPDCRRHRGTVCLLPGLGLSQQL